MGLRPEQFNIKELLRYFVARHEFKRLNLIDLLKDLTPEEKFKLNINENISGDEYNSNYYNHIYNMIKNDIINGNDGLIINDKSLSGEAYYYKSFLVTYPLKYILTLRGVEYSEWETEEELWNKILTSNPEIEYADKIIDKDNNEFDKLNDLKDSFYYQDKDAIIRVLLRNIVFNRNIFASDSTNKNTQALLDLVLNTNPPLSEKVYDNSYLEPKCFYTESYLEKYGFWRVLSARNIPYEEEYPLEKLYELVQDSQTQYNKFEDCNNENLIPNCFYEYDFLRKYGLVMLLRNRGYDASFDEEDKDLENKKNESDPKINDDFSLTLKSLQRDNLRLRSRVDNFIDGTLYKLGENFFVRKGRSNYLGNNHELKITHAAGLMPVAVIINNIENEYDSFDIGDVYVNFDKHNIYVYNTGNARSRFEWNIIFSNNYLPVEKIKSNDANRSYLVKINNFDELELQYNHNYDLSEYSDLLDDENQFFIINGTIYSFNDVRIQFLENNVLYFSKDLVKDKDNEVYITNIPNIDDLFDAGNITIEEEDDLLIINLFNFISKFKLTENNSVIRKITNLEKRLHVKQDPISGKNYYEIDLSEYGNVDNEIVIINGVVYTMYSGSVVFDDDTEVLRIFDFEILPTDEIYITAISDAFYLDELAYLDFEKYIYTNSFTAFGESNYSGNNGETATTIYHGLNKIPAIVNITSIENDGSKVGNVFYTYDNEKITIYNVGKAKTKFRWIAILGNDSDETINGVFNGSENYVEIPADTVLYHGSLSSYPDVESDLYIKKNDNTHFIVTSKNTMSEFRINTLRNNIIYKHKRYLEYANGNNVNEDGKFDNDKDSKPNGSSHLNYSGSFRASKLEGIGRGYTEELPIVDIYEEFNNGDLISYNAEKDSFQKAKCDGYQVIGTYNSDFAINAKSNFKYNIPVNIDKLNYVNVHGIVGNGDILILNPMDNGTAISLGYINLITKAISIISKEDKQSNLVKGLEAIIKAYSDAIATKSYNDSILKDNIDEEYANGIYELAENFVNSFMTSLESTSSSLNEFNLPLLSSDNMTMTIKSTIVGKSLSSAENSILYINLVNNDLELIGENGIAVDYIENSPAKAISNFADEEEVNTGANDKKDSITTIKAKQLLIEIAESYNRISRIPVIIDPNVTIKISQSNIK